MATEDARKLFVAGLAESVSEEVLRQLFEATGSKVVDVSLPRDRATGRVRGFGFVTLASPDEASRARQALDGSIQSGRSISVRPFSSEPPRRGERPEPRGEAAVAAGPSEDRTLYVGNLPYDTTQQELTQLFAETGVGPVARIHLPSGPDGRLRGFGFVTLGTAEAANAAIAALRNVEVRGRRLMVNIAHPRGSGGQSERPGRSRSDGGGWGSDARFTTEPPLSFEGGRSAPDRRAVRENDWSDDGGRGKKKKKRGKGGGRDRSDEGRRRGGGSNWQVWDDDDE